MRQQRANGNRTCQPRCRKGQQLVSSFVTLHHVCAVSISCGHSLTAIVDGRVLSAWPSQKAKQGSGQILKFSSPCFGMGGPVFPQNPLWHGHPPRWGSNQLGLPTQYRPLGKKSHVSPLHPPGRCSGVEPIYINPSLLIGGVFPSKSGLISRISSRGKHPLRMNEILHRRRTLAARSQLSRCPAPLKGTKPCLRLRTRATFFFFWGGGGGRYFSPSVVALQGHPKDHRHFCCCGGAQDPFWPPE